MDPDGPLDYPPPPMPRSAGRPWTIGGFILAAIALVLLPIIFGPAAVVVGVVGLRKGDALGKWAVIAGVAATVLGILVAALLVGSDTEASLLGLAA